MFPARYFCNRYFAPRYLAKVGADGVGGFIVAWARGANVLFNARARR